MRGRKWYKKHEFFQPCEARELGDGSIVEVVADPDERHPDALKLTRIWSDGRTTIVRMTPPNQFSQALYLSVECDIEREIHTGRDGIAEILGSRRAPYGVSSIVPGNKRGDDYDRGTGKRFPSREQFNAYYAENHLAQVGPADIKNMQISGAGQMPDEQAAAASKQFTTYDLRKGPPVPPGYEGAKWHYGKNGS